MEQDMIEERTYSHRSREDLIALRARLSTLDDGRRAAVFCYAAISGISKPPMSVRAVMALLRAKFGPQQGTEKFVNILRSKPAQLDMLWNGVMGWMVDGKDTFDRLSAGGWNKAELDGLLEFVHKIGMPADPVPKQEAEVAAPMLAAPGR